MWRRANAGLVSMLVLFGGRAAHACPSCAQSSSEPRSWLIGVMLLVPLVTAAVAGLAIRRYVGRDRR